MNSPARPAKRSRTGYPHYSNYAKDSYYYFVDGTICVAAQETLFRIHRGVLMRHSQVFREMFSLSKPPEDVEESSDVFETVPVLGLDDKVDDLRSLFRMIYDSPPEDASFDLIESVLRILNKYRIDQYQSWGLLRLKQYPDADDTAAALYDHPKWKAHFHNPNFASD